MSAGKVRHIAFTSKPSEPPPRPEEPMALQIKVQNSTKSFSSYHLYDGGHEFRPVLPRTRLSPGASVLISLERLSLASFISRIPTFELVNRDFTRWLSDRTVVKSLSLGGKGLKIKFNQHNPLVNIKTFELNAVVNKYPGRCNQLGGVYLQCRLVDYIGRSLEMRIRHNGYHQPEFQIDRGAGFETVTLMSYDGFRLSLRYGKHGTTSTFYLAGPSELAYESEPPQGYSGHHLDLVQGMFTRALLVDSVRLRRKLEQTMFQFGSSYDQGRIGSEIAYFCSTEYLGLRNLVIEEPSKRGKDLYTLDTRTSLQARMLKNMPGKKLGDAVQIELLSLVRKLAQDYSHNPKMRTGYAILSFVDSGNAIKTLIVEAKRPREWNLSQRDNSEHKPAEGFAPSTPRLRGV